MWFYYGLITAVCTTINTLIAKKVVKKHDTLSVAFITIMISIPCMLAILVSTKGFPQIIDKQFYTNMGISSILDVIAFALAIYALSISDISLLGPLSSLSIIFTTILAWIFLKEVPEPLKLVGVISVAIGAYWLNIESRTKGTIRPFIDLFKHRGIQFFLVSAAIWSITPLFQKKALFHVYPQSPLFTSFFGYILVGAMYLAIVIFKRTNIIKPLKQSIKYWIVYGISMAVSQWAAYTAFSMTHLGYAMAVFKLSSVFIVIVGAVVLKEEKFRSRLIGSIIILAGTIFLII